MNFGFPGHKNARLNFDLLARSIGPPAGGGSFKHFVDDVRGGDAARVGQPAQGVIKVFFDLGADQPFVFFANIWHTVLYTVNRKISNE